MRHAFRQASIGEPIATINTTPMIDVMLVLLIMMMMSLPGPTHKIPVDLPVASPSDAAPPPTHRLTIAASGAYLWDDAPISAAALPARLRAQQADPARPVLQLETNPSAPYVRFDETMGLVKQAGIERIGFVGNAPGF